MIEGETCGTGKSIGDSAGGSSAGSKYCSSAAIGAPDTFDGGDEVLASSFRSVLSICDTRELSSAKAAEADPHSVTTPARSPRRETPEFIPWPSAIFVQLDHRQRQDRACGRSEMRRRSHPLDAGSIQFATISNILISIYLSTLWH